MHKLYTNAYKHSIRTSIGILLIFGIVGMQVLCSQIDWKQLIYSYQHLWRHWLEVHPYLGKLLFTTILALANLLCIPVNTILRILCGVLFGLSGIPYALLGSAVGASANYWVGHVMTPVLPRHIYTQQLAYLRATLAQHPIMYLLAFRILPVFPAWLVSIVAGGIRYHFITFLAISICGFLPASCIYVYIGAYGVNFLYEYYHASLLLVIGVIFCLIKGLYMMKNFSLFSRPHQEK